MYADFLTVGMNKNTLNSVVMYFEVLHEKNAVSEKTENIPIK